MRSLVFTLILLLGSTASAATVASEVSTSVRNAYRNDFTANMVVTKAMGDWNQKVINGQPIDANAEIKFYAAELRKHGIELHLIATPALRPLLKVNGL
tara:strand:+ start:270 stop:563 length:294 start_codon:yes stop_codon:yes gene_type:complete